MFSKYSYNICICFQLHFQRQMGWMGGAMVLGKLPGPEHPTNLDNSMARAYCTCSRCRWGLFGHFFSLLLFLSSFSLFLWETA